MNEKKAICLQCRKEYYKKYVNQKYCTQRCFYNSRIGKPHPNRGKKIHTEKWKKILSEKIKGDNNPMRNITAEKEKIRVQKMSQTLKKLYQDMNNHPRGMLGKHRTEKFKKHMSKIMKEKMKNGELYSFSEYNSDPKRFRDSSIEKIMREKLMERQITYKKHVRILGTPDILVNDNLAVFVDGCYWHGCLSCCPNSPHINNKHDPEVTKGLEKQGYKVLRFWGHEIRTDPDGCANRVEEVMNS